MRILTTVLASAAVALTAGCGPATVADSTPAPAPAAVAPSVNALVAAPSVPLAITVAAAPVQLTIPDVIGKNGAIASDELKKLGFKHVSYASGTPGVRMVILASNWTVKSIEPGIGTPADPDDTVVLTMVKING
ncbi:PASTA domain-containing protein [Nocardia sp. BMG111209]|uniref:PASTA domain-containing protein n=1 Tax=Nocardia sp. BMG111209 TaxID=1160137 RepID=UPI00036FE0E3|nr:PASTA domain-containing protein [Nocardia sp. BMG111209]